MSLISYSLTRIAAAGLVAVLLLLLAACSGATTTPTGASLKTSPTSVGGLAEVSAVQAAADLAVGTNRFPFGVFTRDGQGIRNASIQVDFFLLGQNGADVSKGSAKATYYEITETTPHTHADGQVHNHESAIGYYVVDSIKFEAAGYWEARLTITGGDIPSQPTAKFAFQVYDQFRTAAVGEAVPASTNPTAKDVAKLSEISTMPEPDPKLYQLTVAEALQQRKPFVLVFATPLYCASRMCGPVTDIVANMAGTYGSKVNFIHIEPWKLDIARKEGKLVPADVTLQWKLPTEPWVFVVGADGKVAARFEGVVSAAELEPAIKQVQ